MAINIKLTDREQIDWLANHVMDWHWGGPVTNCWLDSQDNFQPKDWSPLTNHNHVAQVLKRIGELKLQQRFAQELLEIFNYTKEVVSISYSYGSAESIREIIWAIANATPYELMAAVRKIYKSNEESVIVQTEKPESFL